MPALELEIARMVRRDRILVATDFDGTLSDLVDDPDRARPVEGAIEALKDLAALRGVSVAVVSGRKLDDLLRLVGRIEGVELVGEHGAVWRNRAVELPDGYDLIRAGLEALAADYTGARVEAKQTSLSLHTRGLTEAAEEELRQRAETYLDDHAPDRHARGNHVIDVRLAGASKAGAVEELRVGHGAVVFLGDDTTDESVFEAARPGDVMVKVGQGSTAASHRVREPADVVSILESVGRLRRANDPGRRE